MAVENPATVTAASLTDQFTASVEVTVRVTHNATGTLFEAVETQLCGITGIEDVTITENVTIAPRNGSTHVTVIADVTAAAATSQTELVETIGDAICVEAVEAATIT